MEPPVPRPPWPWPCFVERRQRPGAAAPAPGRRRPGGVAAPGGGSGCRRRGGTAGSWLTTAGAGARSRSYWPREEWRPGSGGGLGTGGRDGGDRARRAGRGWRVRFASPLRRYSCGPTVYDRAHLGHARWVASRIAAGAGVCVWRGEHRPAWARCGWEPGASAVAGSPGPGDGARRVCAKGKIRPGIAVICRPREARERLSVQLVPGRGKTAGWKVLRMRRFGFWGFLGFFLLGRVSCFKSYRHNVSFCAGELGSWSRASCPCEITDLPWI